MTPVDFQVAQMKNDLCGASIESLGACDRPVSSGQTPLWVPCLGPQPQRLRLLCLVISRRKSLGTQSTCYWSGFLKLSRRYAFRGALPDDTEALQSLDDTHKVIHLGAGPHTTHMGNDMWVF